MGTSVSKTQTLKRIEQDRQLRRRGQSPKKKITRKQVPIFEPNYGARVQQANQTDENNFTTGSLGQRHPLVGNQKDFGEYQINLKMANTIESATKNGPQKSGGFNRTDERTLKKEQQNHKNTGQNLYEDLSRIKRGQQTNSAKLQPEPFLGYMNRKREFLAKQQNSVSSKMKSVSGPHQNDNIHGLSPSRSVNLIQRNGAKYDRYLDQSYKNPNNQEQVMHSGQELSFEIQNVKHLQESQKAEVTNKMEIKLVKTLQQIPSGSKAQGSRVKNSVQKITLRPEPYKRPY